MKHERQPEPIEQLIPETERLKKYDLKELEYSFTPKKKKLTIFKTIFNATNVLIYIVGLVAIIRYLIGLF